MDLNTRDSILKWMESDGKPTCFIVQWFFTGTPCSEHLWSLHPWRSSQTIWTWSWATDLMWPCLSSRVGPGGLQRSLPNSTILHDSVKSVHSYNFSSANIWAIWLLRVRDSIFLLSAQSLHTDKLFFTSVYIPSGVVTLCFWSCWFTPEMLCLSSQSLRIIHVKY